MREPFRLSVRCSSSPACPTSRLNKSEAPLSLALGRLRKLDKGPGGRLLAERGPSCPVHRRSRKYLRRIPPPGPYPGRVCEPNKIKIIRKIQKSRIWDNGTGAPGGRDGGRTHSLTRGRPGHGASSGASLPRQTTRRTRDANKVRLSVTHSMIPTQPVGPVGSCSNRTGGLPPLPTSLVPLWRPRLTGSAVGNATATTDACPSSHSESPSQSLRHDVPPGHYHVTSPLSNGQPSCGMPSCGMPIASAFTSTATAACPIAIARKGKRM